MKKEGVDEDSPMKHESIDSDINSMLLPEDKNALINFDCDPPYKYADAEYESHEATVAPYYCLYRKQQPLSNNKMKSCSREEHCGIYLFHYALYMIMVLIKICVVILCLLVSWIAALLFER
jgi:hypothetical protein